MQKQESKHLSVVNHTFYHYIAKKMCLMIVALHLQDVGNIVHSGSLTLSQCYFD